MIRNICKGITVNLAFILAAVCLYGILRAIPYPPAAELPSETISPITVELTAVVCAEDRPAPTAPPHIIVYKGHVCTDTEIYELAKLAARSWDGNLAKTAGDMARLFTVFSNRKSDLYPWDAARMSCGSGWIIIVEQRHIDAASGWLNGGWETVYPLDATHFTISPDGTVKIW
ncbi:MAG: hypothetical protein FWF10_11320 [Clostridiales bacterium]|nr:hypothetical protein [Clostridiales bacterium]